MPLHDDLSHSLFVIDGDVVALEGLAVVFGKVFGAIFTSITPPFGAVGADDVADLGLAIGASHLSVVSQ